MAYNKDIIFKEALDLVNKHNLIFIDEVLSLLPIHNTTFYEWYPAGSERNLELKAEIDKVRIKMKANMRRKWYDSDNASLQIGLMKLIGNEDEVCRLSGNVPQNKANEVYSIKWNVLDAD
jgi:hypothetical protein